MRLLIALVATCAFAQVASTPIREASGSTQTSRPITLSKVFKQGDIPAYARPRVNGIALTSWQVDAKARWGDGSLKHGLISFLADLPASTSITVDFVNNANPCHLGNQATCSAAGYDGAGMLALRSGAWAATIAVTNGTTQTANARTMLTGGFYTYWLRGPVVTEMVVQDLATRTYDMGFTVVSGSPVLGLHPQFLIRAYPGYTAGIRQEYILENCWTDRLADQSFSIVAANSSGTVYSRASYNHYFAGRWHRGNEAAQIWDGTAPGDIEIDHNFSYLTSTKAIHNYDLDVTVPPATVTTLLASYNATDKGDDFGDSAGLFKDLSGTGGRPEIGWVDQTELRSLVSASRTLEPVIYYRGDVAGHIPIHYREASGSKFVCPSLCTGGNATVNAYGHSITADSRPTLWASLFSSTITVAGDKVTPLGSTTRGGWTWDSNGNATGHHPSLAYLPYLLTGSYYLREELLFWAGYLSADTNPGFLNYSRNGNWSLTNPRVQTRTAAWQIRSYTQAAFILPDDEPEKEWLTAVIAKNDEFWEGIANITTGNHPPADSSCPGYGAANPAVTSSPSTAPNRSAWCFGRKYIDLNRTSALNQFVVRQPASCQTQWGWAIFDCSASSSTTLGEVMSPGYAMYTMGWASENGFGFDKVLEKYAGFFTGLEASGLQTIYLWLGGSYSYFTPGLTSANGYWASYADMDTATRKTGSTTLSADITSSTATTFTVADYTQLSFKPMWNRTSATAISITALSVSSGTITVTFSDVHGLAAGDTAYFSGHATAAFNRPSPTGAVITVPSSTQIAYTYSGSTPPADGSYSIGSFVARTGMQTVALQVGAEKLSVCSIETNGVVTVGSSGSGLCNVFSYQRGRFLTTATTHTAGETVSPAYDTWEYASDLQNGYNWISRGAASYLYAYSGTSLWSWIDTNMWTPYKTAVIAAANPAWMALPRAAGGLRITTSGLPSGTESSVYSASLAATGVTGTGVWTVQSGTLPTGLSLATNGTISGTPSGAIATSVLFRVTDSATYREVRLGIGIQPSSVAIVITPPSLSPGTVGSSYSQTMTATGGTAPYGWSIIGAGNPPGTSLTSTGIFQGNPTTGGVYSFTIRATDALGNTQDKPYTMTIAWLPLSITTGATLPSGTIGTPYSTTIVATGGSGSNTWTVTGGTFPAGLSLNASTGAITGTPSTPLSPYSFTLRVDSSDGQNASRTFSLTVPAPAGYTTRLGNIILQGGIGK